MKPVWNFKWDRMKGDESGYVLLMSLLVMMVLFMIGIALSIVGIQEYNLSARVKLMDQAYAIADAGVNRAAVHIQMNPSISQGTTPGPYPTAQYGPITENFGGGDFTWTIYQSETVLNPSYKVLRSTGKITKSERTAERTIETRIIVGAAGEEYDASFDYCIYNGMRIDGEGATWPGVTYWIGNFLYDGYTPYKGRSPKGAIYTKGNMRIPSRMLGDVKMLGNIVATGNITLDNMWAVNWDDPSLGLSKGNIVAGVDGSGWALVDCAYSLGGKVGGVRIKSGGVGGKGNVVAADDVTVQARVNIGACPIDIDGVKAGRDALITGTVNLSSSLTINNFIISGRKTTIESSWASGITVNSIFAGQHTDGTGVRLGTKYASSINAANIKSRGMVHATATLAGVVMGTITAGNDQSGTSNGGTGLQFDMDYASGCYTGNITSNGMVDLRANLISTIQTGSITAGSSLTTASPNNTGVYWRGSNLSSITTGGGAVTGRGDIIATMASGSHITTGDIWSGGKVELQGKEWLTLNDTITTGSISAKGNVHVTSGDTLTVNGSITSESWVRVYLAFLVEGTGWDDIRITGSVSAGSATIPSGSGAGKSIYINNNVDFPGPDEVVIIGDSIKAVGPITILGNDTVQTGNIESNSNVDVSWSLGYWGSSNRYYLGHIYAGGYVDIYTDAELTGVDDSINTGAVRAGSYARMRCHDEIRTDSIWANGNITLESTWKDVTPGNPIQVSGYLQSRGNVKYDYSGEGNGWISGGVWGASVEIDHNQVTSGDVSIGLIGGNDSVRGAGAVSIEGSYDLTSTDIFLNGGSGDIRYNGSLYTYDTSYGSAYNGYTSLPTSYTNPGVTAPSVATPDIPTKPDPVYVDRNGALNEPGPDLQDKNVDVLYEAGLTSTVNLLEPNWSHFQTMAEMDDVSNPGAPHMIYDNGPGDSGTTLGEILFVWDATKPYSSQETVYNGDPDVDIIIDKLHWQHVGAAFEGTIVSRGDIYISSSDTNWFMGSEQILNLVAGGEIMSRTAGLTLAESNNCHYHFWAYGDIRLENMRFGLIGVNTFYGSFTAGNRVYYADNSFWTSTEFKWSRWALDPVAWVPPFKVLTWREV